MPRLSDEQVREAMVQAEQSESRAHSGEEFRPVRLVEDLADSVADLATDLLEARAERDTLRFLPIGDNHHNALMCPYCNPKRIDPEKERHRAERIEAENARLRALFQRHMKAAGFTDSAIRAGLREAEPEPRAEEDN